MSRLLMRRSDNARGVAARGVVAVALKLHVASWLCRMWRNEESKQGSHFTLSPPWKDSHGRHFPDDFAERRGLVLVWRAIVLGIIHLIDGAAADDGAHFN